MVTLTLIGIHLCGWLHMPLWAWIAIIVLEILSYWPYPH